ncbi:MAG TPA: PKD domain-containing protein [Rudaea sp.]|nr:PKD domain-containing protein [Rudaea sp.]
MKRLSAALACVGLCVAFGLAHADPIDCNTTPFGKGDRMVQDDEFISLFGGGATSGFGEYRLPFAGEMGPLTKVYDTPLPVVPLDAINVDLNGDGRDEVAVAFKYLNTLYISVYERTDGFAPGYQLLRDWQWNAGPIDFSQVHMIAGDFAGSRTRTQQLAVLWSGGASDGRLHLVILTGAPDGGIANADNTQSGEWHSTGNFFAPTVGLARGDFLLDGRDQIAVVSANNSNLYYDLLEYNDQSATVSVNSGLPINVAGGDTAIGSKEFTSDISSFADDAFDSARVGFTYPTCQSPNSCTQVMTLLGEPYKIVASGGDIVDSASAELVVHVTLNAIASLYSFSGLQTQQGGPFLAQRLLHFAATQSAPGGDISGVSLSSSGSGRDFDSSQVLGVHNSFNGLPAPEATTSDFDAAIGAVDGQEKESVALVRVVNGGQLETDVYKASVRLNAGYQFTVHAAFGPFPADFTNTSTGDVQDVSWDFGDGSNSVATNPSHAYNATGNYTVKLTVMDSAGKTSTYSKTVTINGQASTGGTAASYTYQMTTTPVYSAVTADKSVTPPVGHFFENIQNDFTTGSAPHIAIGDMNRDGFAEIMTLAQSVTDDVIDNDHINSIRRATIWRSLWRIDPTTYAISGKHAQQVVASGTILPPANPYTAAAALASDFDGDSVYATLGSDCRAVSEPQLRNLVWMPPFFEAMQSGSLDSGFIAASFGINEKSGSGTENRSGSFTGNSISGYVGTAGEYSTGDKPFDFRVAGSLKFTAGHDWQSEHGAIHGSDTEYDYSEGQSASVGEGLVVAEGDDANCYSYNVVQSTGAVPNSSLRMCQITYQERTAMTAETWNNQSNYASVAATWVPLQRDWASIAMFRPATSTIPFSSGKGLENATDGLFSTPASSVTTTEPYLDIDLGSVQDVSSMRVFPAADMDASGNLILPLSFLRAMPDLVGFRIYASATPFSGPDVPSGPDVSVFVQGANNDQIYDRWNIYTLDANLNPLRVRYIRLQHPGQSPARINVSQIEVFGATHLDPPAFPDAVCEPTAGNGYFLARVWNPVAAGYQNIEERGDLMWSGTNGKQQPTGVKVNGQDCINYTDVRETTIWNNLRIGNTGITNSWDSTSDTTNTVGSYGSFESSTRVGAELDFEIGTNAVSFITGASYEYTFGVNSDSQTTSFWGNGLQIGGAVGGFDQAFQNLVLTCGYFPHPYSYHLTERGNSSYQHDLYVVDYIVHQPTGGSAWQRGSVPLKCTGQDEIFHDGFGNN